MAAADQCLKEKDTCQKIKTSGFTQKTKKDEVMSCRAWIGNSQIF